MSFTGVLGTADSQLNNIELGAGPSSPPPAADWFPFSLPIGGARRLPGALARRGAPSFPAAPFPSPNTPTDTTWIFATPHDDRLLDRKTRALREQRRAKKDQADDRLSPALLPGFTPPPGPPFTGTIQVPLIPKIQTQDDFQRAKKAIQTLSEMMNSLMQQGYVQRTSFNPVIWKIIGELLVGVISFNNRTGAVTLTANDIITAFGPQNPYQVFAGPVPSFRFLTHLIAGPGTPTATPGAGAGAGAVASVVGTDLSGTITLVTDALDTPAANDTVVAVTFSNPYPFAPFVIFMPSNDAAWDLAPYFGVPRLRQNDVTANGFTIRTGAVPLPALTAATYTFNYIATGSSTESVTDGLFADDNVTFLMADDFVTFLTQG